MELNFGTLMYGRTGRSGANKGGAETVDMKLIPQRQDKKEQHFKYGLKS